MGLHDRGSGRGLPNQMSNSVKLQEENILIIQLSDLHFDADGKSEQITHASAIVKAAFSEAPSHRNVLFLISGDVIDRSEVTGYEWAAEFCHDLKRQVEQYDGERNVLGFVLTPGNHDTIRSENPEAELQVERAISNLSSGKSAEEVSTIDVNLLVRRQVSFFSFAEKLIDSGLTVGSNRFYHTLDFSIGKSGVRFHVLNTSWSCLRDTDDEGRLLLRDLPSQFQVDLNFVNIAVMHHPLRWLERETGYKLEEAMTGLIDITLCGHEHKEKTRFQSKEIGTTTAYLMCPALAGPEGGFQVILINVAAKTFKTQRFTRRGTHYALTENGVDRPLRDELGQVIGGISFSKDFREFLDESNLPTQFVEHDVALADIFIYPKLQNITLEMRQILDGGPIGAEKGKKFAQPSRPQKRTVLKDHPLGPILESYEIPDRLSDLHKFLILSDHRRGKTALARKLTADLRSRNFVPVCLRSDDCTSPTLEKVQEHLKSQIRKQYSPGSYEQCVQCPPKDRVLIIDELNTERFSSSDLSKLLTILQDLSSNIIIICEELNFVRLLFAEEAKSDVLDYQIFRILDLSPIQRRELARRILSSINPHTPGDDLELQIRQCEEIVESVLAEGVVSPSAGEVKLILLGIILDDPAKSSAGAHGFYYEKQILADIDEGFKSLNQRRRTVAPDDVEKFLCQAALRMYYKEDWRLSQSDIDDIFTAFAKDLVDVPRADLLLALERGRLFFRKESDYYFRERYQRFYYSAKAIENLLGSSQGAAESADKIIEQLLERAHEREAADILLFFFYVRRDQDLLRRVAERVQGCFADFEAADMDTSFRFLDNATSREFPGLDRKKQKPTLSGTDCHLEDRDISSEEPIQEALFAVEDVVLRMSEAYNLVSVLGLAVRNNVSLVDEPLRAFIVESGYLVLRRSLTAFNRMIESEDPRLRTLLRKHLKLDPKSGSIQSFANQLAVLSSFGVIRRATRAFGNYRLRPMLHRLWDSDNSVATKMFKLSTELEWKDASASHAKSLYDSLDKNVHAKEVERWVVASYLRSFQVEAVRKDQLCGAVHIASNDPAYFSGQGRPRAFGKKR